MKQYTTPEQTAKLIELGFEKPKGSPRYWRGNELVININYSIGELIELLPKAIIHEICGNGYKGVWGLRIESCGAGYAWEVSYEREHTAHLYREGRTELIDALYDMLVKLKDKGVI